MYFKSSKSILSMVVAFAVLFSLCVVPVVSVGAAEVNPDLVFVKMPKSADLNKEYDGKMPNWVHFDYVISPQATLWTNDTAQESWGLVYLDTYKLNETTGAWDNLLMGKYPGHMTYDGYLNYGPAYGDRYYPEVVKNTGKYKAVWRAPIFGTNTVDPNVYQYVEYSVEFSITPPGIFNSVPSLSRDANKKPVAIPEISYDLSKIGANSTGIAANHIWYVYDPEADNFAGEKLASAPVEIGSYVYRLQVTNGKDVDENLYIPFQLTDPDYVPPFYVLGGGDRAIFDVSGYGTVSPMSKVYDGKPVTAADAKAVFDLAKVDKAGEDYALSYFWWKPDANGNFTQSIAELEGGDIGPTEPGNYNFQYCVNGDNVEAYLYIKFTIAEPGSFINPFKDVKTGAWYYDAVSVVVTQNLFQGTSPNKFEPDETMSLGMFTVVLSRFAGVNTADFASQSTKFKDVKSTDWYAGAAIWASSMGILNVKEDAFEPNRAVTREEMAYMLYRCIQIAGIKLPDAPEVPAFADAELVSGFAKEAVTEIQRYGLMSGSDTNDFNPQNSSTRAEVALLFANILKALK